MVYNFSQQSYNPLYFCISVVMSTLFLILFLWILSLFSLVLLNVHQFCLSFDNIMSYGPFLVSLCHLFLLDLCISFCWLWAYCLVAQWCLMLCDPTDCSTPGFPVHNYLLELVQTHVHWISDAIQPSYPLSSPSLTAFNLSQHQGLFQ